MIVMGIELEALGRLLHDPRFQRNAITGIIALAALARLGRESRARMQKARRRLVGMARHA